MGALVAAIRSAFAALPKSALPRVLSWLGTASKGAITTVESAIAYAKKNPLTAALVVEGLIRGGAEAGELISAMGSDSSSKEMAVSFGRLAAEMADKVDKQHPGLNADEADTERDVLRQQMGRRLVRAFGSLDNARQVQLALETLTAKDFAWLATVGLGRA